jgi:hypothetical protein
MLIAIRPFPKASLIAETGSMLPLAPVHVALGQVDLWLDVLSIVSTRAVVHAYTGWTLCGRSVVPFFEACLLVQLLLLAGNLLSQVGLVEKM